MRRKDRLGRAKVAPRTDWSKYKRGQAARARARGSSGGKRIHETHLYRELDLLPLLLVSKVLPLILIKSNRCQVLHL